jgi:glutamate/tyrosine decarboxylase-like PLP-dependent enzyme
MIGDNIRLAETLYRLVSEHAELEALSNSLSITTFRYVPQDLKGSADAEPYLNQLNSELLTGLQAGGEVFLSNAMLRGKFALRTCIVNFRTSIEDIRALPELVVRLGTTIDTTLRRRKSTL